MSRYRVVVSGAARNDIAAIRAWYKANRSLASAVLVQQSILSAIVALKSDPPLTHMRDDLPPNLYRTLARQYVVLFRCAGDQIDVLRVIHGARHMPFAIDGED
jgi:plasmid stabilization system protein ParE